jgi:metal-dependent amidase/aminoacylase/carboxypeptidase family protein
VLNESRASGAKKDPEIAIKERAQLTVNDDTTTRELKALFSDHFGSHNIIEELPAHPVEDFSKLATVHNVPSVFWWMGRADPKLVDEAKAKGQVEELIPIEHSPLNAPLVRPTMKTGMDAMSLAALSYLVN